VSDDAEDVGWRRLREFSGVDLEHSYALSWQFERRTLLIDVDLQLTPEHPFYERPRPAERVCIRPAIIEFPHCDRMRRDGVAVPPDAVPSLGAGAITNFVRKSDGPYVLSGAFGVVEIDAERPVLRLRNP